MSMIHDQARNDATVVVAVDWLPMHGRAWLSYPGANVVAVSAHLNDVGREMALTEAGVR